ncbi:MAG: hypothetical protein L0G89_01080 [Janibacter sp.]|nr:hypothetical protein [Janibacter sp.]
MMRNRRIPPRAELVGAVMAVGAIFVTVGGVAAFVAMIVLALDRAVLPARRVLGTFAVVAFALVPLLWFAGSTLPLDPPIPRIQANAAAHQAGGVAVWMLFLTVCFTLRPHEGSSHDH